MKPSCFGHAVGMDVSTLQQAGLIAVKADKVNILSAADRRREAPLTEAEAQQLVFGWEPGVGKRDEEVRNAKATRGILHSARIWTRHRLSP